MTLVRDFRRQLEARRDELRPLVEEYEEVQRHLAALDAAGISGSAEGDGGRQRVPFEERADQILRLVESDPGVRVGVVARALGVSSPRVVQIVNRLVKEGVLERQERGGLAIPDR